MNSGEPLQAEDLDGGVRLPSELFRLIDQGLVNLTPWHIMSREMAKQRLEGLRSRYSRKYVPLARRQDNDDLACMDPDASHSIVIVHDFADEGFEVQKTFESFWDWFREVIEDMIAFD
jgi:hypothetical protein